MTDSVFLPPTGSSAGNIPPDVQQAIAHVRAGVGNEADRQVLITYLATGNPDPTIAMAIGNMIGGLGGGAPQGPLASVTTPTPPTPQIGGTSGASPNMGGGPGTDWVVEAQNQGVAPPTPASSGFPGGALDAFRGMLAPTEPIVPVPPGQHGTPPGAPGSDPFGNMSDWWNARDHSQQASLSGAPGPYTIPPSPPGVSPSLPPTPFTGSGPGLPPVAQREEFGRLLGRNTRRADRASERGGLAPEDWKKLAFSMDPNSAFAGLAPGMASLYTQDPTLAALQMYGPDTAVAGQMTPQVSGALELAQMGALGGHGKGLGSGPSSAAGQLRLAEEMMQGLGPGDYIDPRLAYKKAFRMTQRTPGEEMYAGHSGTQGDIQNQIEVTNSALANAAGPWMTEGGIQGLANQLNRAAQDWLQKKSVGQMDLTYPQYLKSIGAQRWVSPGIV